MAPDYENSDSYAVTELQQSLTSKCLELAYEQYARKSDILFQEEDARQLRLRILLLEDDNDDLHGQLAQEDDRIDSLEQERQRLRDQMEQLQRERKAMQNELRVKAKELENAKAELSSVNAFSNNSTKLLTEKLALAHELASLKPELEHLRSQAAAYQSTLSEKLSLQRQLSTLQVELETEKRAAQRALNKEGKESAQDTKLQAKVDTLKQELAKEKRERERAERDAKKGSDEWEGKRAVLESKLEATRGKLRAAKEQLKEKEVELLQAQNAAVKAASGASKPASTSAPVTARNPRKRNAADASVVDFGTPDGMAVKGRKPGAKKDVKAAVGDKSTFSMTPFLNRTASIAPESPIREEEEERDDGADEPEEPDAILADPVEEILQPSPSRAPKAKAAKATANIKTKPAKDEALKTAKVSKANATVPQKRRAAAPVLEKVMEEENEENVVPSTTQEPTAKPAKKVRLSFAAIMEETEPKKKKRKMLAGGVGKTLFDEDDAEPTKALSKSLFSGAKGFAGLSRGGLAGTKTGIKGGLGVVVGGFGEISPLKKDKKTSR